MGLTYSSVVDAGRDEVFSWHARPGAIVRLTPPWQPVTVLREAGSLRDGRATLRLPGGLRWVADCQPGGYDPPNAFADSLLRLPWRHTHRFSPVGEAATLVTDVVETPLPASSRWCAGCPGRDSVTGGRTTRPRGCWTGWTR